MDIKNTDEIIYAYLEGSAKEAELLNLLNWIKQSDENVRYFNQICNIWENHTNVSTYGYETEIALNKLNARIQSFGSEKFASLEKRDNDQFLFWRIAAIAVVLIGLSVFFYFALNRSSNVPVYITAISPKSQKSQLILADGTKVWLNSGTTLKYKSDYGNTDRRIYLNGEAYFEVAKNPSRPFLVFASNIVVKAIGTSFNVKCYADDNTIETTLVEGKVQISRSNDHLKSNSVFLLPNQTAIFNRLNNKMVVAKFNKPHGKKMDEKAETSLSYIKPKSIESVISWKNEELIFENEPFDELTKRLERWYNVEIQVLNPEVNLRNSYTGKFVHNESLEQVLKIISRTTPIKYTFRNGEVLIEAKRKL